MTVWFIRFAEWALAPEVGATGNQRFDRQMALGLLAGHLFSNRLCGQGPRRNAAVNSHGWFFDLGSVRIARNRALLVIDR